jgi:DNA-binding transcriptional regulator YdaS (Cro superfamily)
VPDPYDTLARLTRLARERARQDELLGRACLLVRRFGSFRQLGFFCFDEWCAERLGLAPSTVRQRIALERRLHELPALREALRSGRLSYEQARLVARVAGPADVAARIEEAAAMTCIAYRRALEGEEHRQMWRAGELRTVVPDEVDDLLADALRAARACSRHGLTPGEALVLVALHFIHTWKDEVNRLLEAADRVILRDCGLCQIPGCSRPADHVHHLIPRWACGPLEPWNELSVCAIHHLRGVHGGSVRITGRAPDGLAFTLGEREVAAARA